MVRLPLWQTQVVSSLKFATLSSVSVIPVHQILARTMESAFLTTVMVVIINANALEIINVPRDNSAEEIPKKLLPVSLIQKRERDVVAL